ncbi:MAG: ATP-binding protein [Lachnospiraceae bacterium]
MNKFFSENNVDNNKQGLSGLFENEEMLEYSILHNACRREFYKLLIIDGKTGRAKELTDDPVTGKPRFEYIANIDAGGEKYFNKYASKEDATANFEKMKLEKILKALETEEGYDVFFDRMTKEGQKHFYHAQFWYIEQEQQLICCSISDVTAAVIRSREQQKVLKNSMDREAEALKAKNVFLANMSHEIRTPLNAIVGMAEIAKMDINNPQKVRECMDIILSSSETLVDVVSNILDSNNAQDGGIRLMAVPTNVRELAERIAEEFKSTLKKQNQQLKMKINIQHEVAIVDPDRASRVVLNLLSNAAKFSSDKDIIEFRITELPGKRPGEGFYRVEVKDHGKGISKEDMKHVFEPFYRDRESAENYLSGTGLGLSVVKSIVDAKGANIEIESEPGGGTSVTIVDPVTFVDEVKKNVVENTRVLEGKRVLMVEDQPINMLVAKRMLERFGAMVDTAEHGKIAVEQYLNHPAGTYDMIFMDIQMPIMNGYEATRRIRESGREDAKSVKIVSMTANVSPEDLEKVRQARMNAYISKPFRVEDLQQMIVELLGRQKEEK